MVSFLLVTRARVSIFLCYSLVLLCLLPVLAVPLDSWLSSTYIVFACVATSCRGKTSFEVFGLIYIYIYITITNLEITIS